MNENIAGLRFFYDSEEQKAARIIGSACQKSVQLIQQCWGLKTPEDCRVYVMTSWLRFLFQSAPWHWKIYIGLTLPFVAMRARATWPYAGGWALQYGKRRVIGIKPPRLIQEGNRSLGEIVFIQNRSIDEIVQSVTCHELVHAFTLHLKLPTWLHEGLATLAMELYLDKPIVREDTLEYLDDQVRGSTNGGVENLRVEKPETLVSAYMRGYWLTRYIDETRPGLLKDMLSRGVDQGSFEEMVASAYGIDKDNFWKGVCVTLRSFYQ